jgi:maleylacetoacetate isomerase
MPKLVLHTYWRSSASHRVRIALGYKKLAYDPVFVNLLEGAQKSPAYKAKNPMGYLPCLLVDDKPFVESVAILELLEELHPDPPLLPRAPEDRARVRALVQFVNAGIQPLQNLVVLEQLGDDKERRAAWLRHFIGRGLTAFEALVARCEEETGNEGPFAFGEQFTMADVLLVPQVYAARRYGVDLEACPRVVRAEKAASELAFVKAAHPESQPDAKV